jgi:sugar lactone lactonase YvrE
VCQTAIWNSTIKIIAGVTSSAGSSATLLYNPMGIFYDANNTLFVADSSNNRIQKFVNGSSTGITVSNLSLSNPTAVYITNTNILYIVDYSNYRIQQWNNSIVTTVAGGHGSGSTLDKMSTSYALYIDPNLNIYISEYGNHRISLWTAGNTTAGQMVRNFISLRKFYLV